MDDIIAQALSADRESKSIEFKSTFDPSSDGEWCELLKDIIAIANTDGGILIVGLDSTGVHVEADIGKLKSLDPAVLSDKIYRFTRTAYSEFQFAFAKKADKPVFAIIIGKSLMPLVFEQPGSYHLSTGELRNAFAKGTIYFRHGAKSEPGNNEDLRRSFDCRVDAVRDSWMKNIRQVIEAPMGSRVLTLPPDSTISLTDVAEAHAVRLENSPDAIPVTIAEEDIRKIAPYDYRSLTKELRNRYSNFVENLDYHKLRRQFEADPKFCRVRILDPINPRSSRQRFYTEAILLEFDKHYTKRAEPP